MYCLQSSVSTVMIRQFKVSLNHLYKLLVRLTFFMFKSTLKSSQTPLINAINSQSTCFKQPQRQMHAITKCKQSHKVRRLHILPFQSQKTQSALGLISVALTWEYVDVLWRTEKGPVVCYSSATHMVVNKLD